MTRALLQQALTALESLIHNKPFDGRFGDVVIALREELAKPEQEPTRAALPQILVAIRQAGLTLVKCQGGYQLVKLGPVTAQPAQEQTWKDTAAGEQFHQATGYGKPTQKASQPAQEPLTDAQKQEIHNHTGAGHALICLVESYIRTGGKA